VFGPAADLREALEGLPPDRVAHVASVARQPLSLGAPIGADGEATVGDLIPDPQAESPLSTLLADEKVNILYVQTVTNDDRTVSLRITIEVENVSQLSRVLHKIESVPAVDEVRRDASNGSTVTRLAGD